MTSILVLLALGVAVVIADGVAHAQAPPAAPSSSAPAAVSPAPAGGSYERRGRRDPFDPINALDAAMASPTVASAKLKGIVRSQTPRALVETPDGLGYILKVGDMLGEGRLVEIGVDTVVFSIPARRGPTPIRFPLRLPDD